MPPTSPLDGYLTRRDAAEKYQRNIRTIERWTAKALASADPDERKLLDYLKLRGSDGRVEDGVNVTTKLIEQWIADKLSPEWLIHDEGMELIIKRSSRKKRQATPPTESADDSATDVHTAESIPKKPLAQPKGNTAQSELQHRIDLILQENRHLKETIEDLRDDKKSYKEFLDAAFKLRDSDLQERKQGNILMARLLQQLGYDPEEGQLDENNPQLSYVEADVVKQSDAKSAESKSSVTSTANPASEHGKRQVTSDQTKQPANPGSNDDDTPGFLDWDFSTLQSLLRKLLSRP